MDGDASVYIDYAAFRYAGAIVNAADPLRISGCSAYGHDSLEVFGSELTASSNPGQCGSQKSPSRFIFEGDRFDPPADSTALAITGTLADTLEVVDNHFYVSGHVPTAALYVNTMDVHGIIMAGPGSNTFSSRGEPSLIQIVNGTVPAGRSWDFASPDGAVLEGQVNVDGTVHLAPGAVLTSQAVLDVVDHGSVLAEGTAARPVQFAKASAVQMTGAGTLVLLHTVFSGSTGNNVSEAVSCTQSGDESVEIERSLLTGQVDLGNCDSRGNDTITVENDRFEVPAGVTALSIVADLTADQRPGPPASPGRLVIASNVFAPRRDVPTYSVPKPPLPEVNIFEWDVQHVALSGAAANHFLGTGASRVVDVNACGVPPGSSWAVTTAPGAVLETQTDYFAYPGLVVQGRLDLGPGVIVKVGITRAEAGGIGVGYGIDLGAGGELDALGTAAHHIVFTSMDDNSVGGESSGAPTVPTQNDYISAVDADEGSKVDVSYASFRHGWYAFTMSCAVTPQNGGSFALTDSLVQDEIELGDCDGSDHGYVPQLVGDDFDFDGARSGNFAAGGGYDPDALQPALLLYNVDPTGVVLAGAGANVFSGSGAGRVVALSGTEVPAGESWTVSGATGAVLAMWPDYDYLTKPGVTIDGSMTLGPGTIVKSDLGNVGLEVTEPGHLYWAGTSSQPVVFIAIADDSVGGDSNGEKNASVPKPGAYGTGIQFDHLSADMPISNAVFKYANDALSYLFMSHDATVSHTDFVKNVDAMEVEETSGPDYDGLGDIPCVPPWLSGVVAEDDWFGPHGWPAPDLDLASFIGAHIPGSIPYSGTAFNISGIGNLIDEEHGNFGLGNAVPWAIYSCAKLPFSFPLTAVEVENKPGAPHYAKFDRAAVGAALGARRSWVSRFTLAWTARRSLSPL